MAGSARQRRLLYLIDASIYVFRAWHALPGSIATPAGDEVNAVYGFGAFIAGFLEKVRPTHAAVLFDESLTSSFRNRMFPGYKRSRGEPPDNLLWQFRLCRRLVRGAGLAEYASRRYEADDLIGTIATRMRPRGFSMVYVSRDKDLLQLMRDGDVYWDFAADRRIGAAEVRAALGVRPDQVVDYMALSGDPIDDIPGVPGIGPKTAAALINSSGSLEELYARLDHLPRSIRGAARIRQRLHEYRAQVFLARRLATIHGDIPMKVDPERLRWRGPNLRALNRLFNELGFGERLRKRFRELGVSLGDGD